MSIPIGAGELDRLVDILQRSVAKDAGGRETVTWPPRATKVWAKYYALAGGLKVEAGQVVNASMHRFVMRWRSDVLETDRISFNGGTYKIEALAELGRHEFLQITASKVVAQ